MIYVGLRKQDETKESLAGAKNRSSHHCRWVFGCPHYCCSFPAACLRSGLEHLAARPIVILRYFRDVACERSCVVERLKIVTINRLLH